MRTYDEQAFDRSFEKIVMTGTWQEESRYYPRYRSRYAAVLRTFAAATGQTPVRVLEVGGGQLAAMARDLWSDEAWVGDINDACFPTLENYGVQTARMNLATGDGCTTMSDFDVVLLSEVIEHLPVPGHVALSRLRAMMRPGGILICSTPNLYRLRNVVYLALGRTIFDHFDTPGDTGGGHVLEYSAEHLVWQFEQAGFTGVDVALEEFRHAPNRSMDRLLSTLGRPLLRVPRFRDNLLATAVAPTKDQEAALTSTRPRR